MHKCIFFNYLPVCDIFEFVYMSGFCLTEHSSVPPCNSGDRQSTGQTGGRVSRLGRWTKEQAGGHSHPAPRAPKGAPEKTPEKKNCFTRLSFRVSPYARMWIF